MDTSVTSIINILVSLISPLLIFIAVCYYISKSKKADALLLFTGSGISLVLNVVYLVIMPYFIRANYMPVSEVTQYYSILGIVGIIGGILFATGLFILIYNTVNTKKIVAQQFPLQ